MNKFIKTFVKRDVGKNAINAGISNSDNFKFIVHKFGLFKSI